MIGSKNNTIRNSEAQVKFQNSKLHNLILVLERGDNSYTLVLWMKKRMFYEKWYLIFNNRKKMRIIGDLWKLQVLFVVNYKNKTVQDLLVGWLDYGV